jgi:hypothetical protein
MTRAPAHAFCDERLEAQDHLEFHRTYNTDIVEVMNDFDYPQSTTGKWYEPKPLDSPSSWPRSNSSAMD